MYTTTLTTTLAAIGIFALSVAAQDVELNDYPMQCDAVCAPVASLTQQCDLSSGDSDRQENDCICNATNASTAIPECEACYANFDRDGHDNDIFELIRDCGFTTTTYNQPTAAASGGMIAGAPVANSREGAVATATAIATATGNATVSASGSVATATAGTESGTVAQNSAGTEASAPASTGAGSSNGVAGGVVLVAGLLGMAAFL